MSSKLVLRPPDHFHSFTLYGGCGKEHKFDGSTPIDCDACVAHVATMSPEQRVQDPFLRAPSLLTGDTPAEIRRQQELDEQRRHAMSYRLEEAAAPAKAEEPSGGDEIAKLQARIAELEAEKKAQPPAATETARSARRR